MPDKKTENENTPEITLEEKQAIEALHRLSRRWPKSLCLSVRNGKTIVQKYGHTADTLEIPHS